MLSLFGPASPPPSKRKSKPKAADGKEFEREIGRSFSRLGAEHINTNNPVPGCDRRACVPFVAGSLVADVVGVSVLVEVKELRADDRFPFSRISKRERDFLLAHARAGGLSFLLIKRIDGERVRCWAWTWGSWLLKVEGGSKLKSISLPIHFDPVPTFGQRIQQVKSEWDLAPLLAYHGGQLHHPGPIRIAEDGTLSLERSL